MQKIQIDKVSEEILNFIENLAYNGLNMVSNENIRQIEFFLQNASSVEAYRLATSLRYLHVELKRFLNQTPAFNIERYAFFLTNCWLLSRGFLFQENNKDGAPYTELLGNPPRFKTFNILQLRLVGVEKIFLEGTIFGVILYFLSLAGKTKGEILKWNILQPPRGVINPEILLTLEIPDQGIAFKELMFLTFNAHKLSCSEKEGLISLNKEKGSKINLPDIKKEFPLDVLEQYDYSIKDLYEMISSIEYTPFDMPSVSHDYVLVKNVKVIDYEIEGEENSSDGTRTYLFKLSHERAYPVQVRLQDKHVNQFLIDNFKQYHKNGMELENLFGKIILDRGNICIFPLSAINQGIEEFICISDIQQDYREIMKTLYKK